MMDYINAFWVGGLICVIEQVAEKGAIGIFTGGVMATAGGITAAVVFGFLVSVIFNPKVKK